MTGVYLRVKRNGKYENIEIEHLTNNERHKLFTNREPLLLEPLLLLQYLDLTCETLRENEKQIILFLKQKTELKEELKLINEINFTQYKLMVSAETRGIEKATEDFNNRTCKNCKYCINAEFKNLALCDIKKDTPMNDCYTDADFGCNKFERKVK